MVEKGRVRLRTPEYYRRWENTLLGDPNDGKGLYHLGGHPLQTDSGNDVYVWCFSLPTITHDRMLQLAREGSYTCVLVVDAPEEFFRRVRDWLSAHHSGYQLHCGRVTYDRGEHVTKKAANAQKFHFNIFQKAPKFQDDSEYRMLITNATFVWRIEDYLDLEVGSCSAIMSIRALPIPTREQTP
ncbi:MAG: hypothetical protein ACREVR_17150 [Burkholderiales bacterium]